MEKVKDSLIDGDIISGNENEDVKVTYMNKNGQSSSIESSANHNDDVSSTQSNFSKLSHIDITRQNVGSEDFNKVLDGKTTWDKFVKGLLDKGLVTDGQSVSIQAVDPTNSSTTTITGTVGGGVTNGNGDKLTKRFINKITIE